MSVSVVILAYQEEENLRILLPKIIRNVEKVDRDYEIIVVDTAKPLDHTEDVCREYGAKYVNQRYPQFGGAFRTAIEEASKEYFLILDGDGSHDPDMIPQIYQKFVSENRDLVIGSRYVKGGKTNDSKCSILMSRILNTVFRITLGIDAKDISTDYRLYHTQMLKRVPLQCKNYDILEEVLLKMQLQKGTKLDIGEVPIEFNKRVFGESKRKLVAFIISYLKTLFYLLKVRITKKMD